MSNTQSLIEEVKSDLSKYADAHLLDEDSMYRDIVLGLKRFGNDLLEIHEIVVEVDDGEAQLPENFKVMYFAYLCEPLGVKKIDTEVHHLQDSIYYTEKTLRTRDWSECDDCSTVSDTVIKENLYFREKKAAEFYYHRPQLLSLGKTFHKSACHKFCRNKMIKDNPNEIVIIKTTLQANFKEGHIYMQYYGLPMDENGMIEIPDTFNGHLEEYLEYRVKRKSAERLIGNNDAVALSNMLGYFSNEESKALVKASSSIKMGKIKPKGMKRWSRLNKLEALEYESALTRQR